MEGKTQRKLQFFYSLLHSSLHGVEYSWNHESRDDPKIEKHKRYLLSQNAIIRIVTRKQSTQQNFRVILRTHWIELVIALLCGFGLAIGSNFFLLIATLLASYFIGIRLPRTFFTTGFSSILLGLTIILALSSVFLTILWITAINVSLPLSLVATLLLATVSFGIWGRQFDTTKLIDHKDVASLAVLAIYIALTFAGIVHHNGLSALSSPSKLAFQSITYGIDDISHLMMYQDTLEANAGLLLGSSDDQYVSKDKSASYPKMAHTLIAQFVNPDEPRGVSVGLSYSIGKLLAFALAVLIICRSSLELLSTKTHWLLTVALAVPVLTLVVSLLLHVFIQEGFFSVWPVLVFTPLALLAARSRSFDQTPAAHILVISAALVAITMSWPIMGMPLYLALALWFVANPTWEYKKLAALGVSLFGLTQVFVQVLDPDSDGSQSLFNEPGGIPVIPLLLIGLIAVMSLYSCFRSAKTNAFSLFVCTYIVAALAMSGVIAGMNLYDTAAPQYFYYKTTLLICVILAMFAAALLVKPVVESLSQRPENILVKSMVAAALGITIAINLPLLLGGGTNMIYSAKYLLGGERHVLYSSAESVLDSGKSADFEKMVFVSADSTLENYYINAFMGGVNDLNYCQVAVQTLGVASIADTEPGLRQQCGQQTGLIVTIIDDPQHPNQLSCQDLAQVLAALPESVTVRHKATSTQCELAP